MRKRETERGGAARQGGREIENVEFLKEGMGER